MAATRTQPVGDGAALFKRRPDVRQAERELAAATAGGGWGEQTASGASAAETANR